MKESEKEQWIEGVLSNKGKRTVEEEMEDNPVLLGDLLGQRQDDQVLKALLDTRGEQKLQEGIMAELRGQSRRSLGWLPVAAVLTFSAVLGVLVGSQLGTEMEGAATSDQPHERQEDAPRGTFEDTYAEIAALTSTELATAYQEIETSLSGPHQQRMRQLLVLRWASVDPEGALKFLQEQEARSDLITLFEAWTRLDYAKAWKASQGLVPSVRTKAQHFVLAWLAERDPDRFLELASTASGTQARVWRTAFERILKQGGDLNHYVASLPEAHRKSALEGIAVALVKDDAEKALAWAEEFGDQNDRSTVLGAIIRHLGEADPPSAGRILAKHPQAFTDLGKEIVGRLRQEDPFRALSWIQDHLTGEDRAILYRELFYRTARDSDDRIFAMFDHLLEVEGPTIFRRDHRLDDIFWGTSGLDYRKAIAWVQGLPDGIYGRQHMIPSMVFAWSHHDRESAMAYVAEVENAGLRASLNSQIVNNMLSTSLDREATWNFVEGLDQGRHDRDRAKVVSRWSRTDPQTASERLPAIRKESARQLAITGLATNWARLSPLNAVEWADGLMGSEREVAYAQIARTWSNHDSFRSSEWIGELPEGRLRDLTVEQLVGEVAIFEGERSFEWAVSIGDPEVRKRTTRHAVAAWASQAAEEAQKAINRSALPVNERQDLLKVVAEEGAK